MATPISRICISYQLKMLTSNGITLWRVFYPNKIYNTIDSSSALTSELI